MRRPLHEIVDHHPDIGLAPLDGDRPLARGLVELLCAVALSAPTKSDLQQRDIVILDDPARRQKVTALMPAMNESFSGMYPTSWRSSLRSLQTSLPKMRAVGST